MSRMSHVIAILNHGLHGKGRGGSVLHLDTSLSGAGLQVSVESPMCQQAN